MPAGAAEGAAHPGRALADCGAVAPAAVDFREVIHLQRAVSNSCLLRAHREAECAQENVDAICSGLERGQKLQHVASFRGIESPGDRQIRCVFDDRGDVGDDLSGTV